MIWIVILLALILAALIFGGPEVGGVGCSSGWTSDQSRWLLSRPLDDLVPPWH